MSNKNDSRKIIKAFFETSNENNQENLNIISLLNKNNCNVMQTVIGTDLNYTAGDTGNKASLNIFSNKIKDIVDCDIFICEVSKTSPSLFFLIFEALKRKKPVLAIYKEDSLPKESWLSERYDLFKLHSYNKGDVENTISDFLSFAYKKFPTSRFTIRLNDELCDYTDYLKSKLGCSSRNEVILKLLDDLKKEDYNFNEILENK